MRRWIRRPGPQECRRRHEAGASLAARLRLVWAVALVAASVAGASRAEARGFARQELAVPGSILWVTHGDLNGDGKTDLVVTYRRGAGPAAARFVAVFFRGEEGYRARPDAAFEVPKNAAVVDVGDALGDAADELVYLTSTGVFAQPFNGTKPGQPTRIVATPTLVLEPEEEDLVVWDFLRSGPNLPPTLVVPTRRALKLFRREGDAWKPWSEVEIEQLSYYDAESPTYRRSGRGGSSGRPFAFRVTTVVPNLDFVEQTGDGRVDLVAHFEDRVMVFAAGEDGTLDKKAHRSQWFQLRTPDELETRDSEVSASVVDLDGDGIADLALSKIGGGITTLRSEVRLYRGLKGGGFEAQPSQTFSDAGFGALVNFRDVDGDGRLEMLHPHSEVSIMALSKAMLSSKLGLEVRVRRPAERAAGGGGDLFEKKPAQLLETSFGLDLTVGAALRGTAPLFGHDFDGDGRPDVILSQGGDKMVLHRGIAGPKGPFESEGRITLSAEGTNTTEVLPPRADGTGRPDVLVYYVARKDLTGKLFVFRNLF